MKNKKLAVVLVTLLMILSMLTAIACVGPVESSQNSSTPTSGGPSTESSVTGPNEELDAEYLEEIPASQLKTIAQTETDSATASWFIVYGEDAIEITAYVEDKTPYEGSGIYSSDGVEVRISKVQDAAGYSEGAICIIVGITGEYEVRNLLASAAVVDHGVEVDVKNFTLDRETIAGYMVEISVPYATTEVSKDAKDAAMCLALTNAVDDIEMKGQYDQTYESKYDSVKTWMAVTDNNAYEENVNLRTKIDVLFLGDSYMDLAFWNIENTYDNTMAEYGVNAVNLGVGGTRVDHWVNEEKVDELSSTYAPEAIVIHIGVNDIDDADQGAQEVYDELVALFTLYHEAFDGSDLYWVSLIPNCVFTAKYEVYKQTNEMFSAWAEDKEWVTYINEWDTFCSDEVAEGVIAPVKNMFKVVNSNLEGMHLNHDFGYPTWSSIIFKALGYEVIGGSVIGNAEEAGLYHSQGWVFDTENNQAEGSAPYEKAVWVNGVYAESVLFEAEIYSPAAVQYDPYPKVGLTVRADDVQVFAYIDFGFDSSIVANGDTNIVYRRFGEVGANADWSWGAEAGVKTIGQDVSKNYVKLGVIKHGDVVYMLVDGKIINSMRVPGLTAQTKVAVGVTGFNQVIHVKNVSTNVNASEVEYVTLPEHAITVGEYDNTTVTFNRNTAKRGDEVTFTVESEAPVAEVKVNGEVLTAKEGVYSFIMPNEEAKVVISFSGLLSVDMSAVDGRVAASTLTPYEGATVTFTATETTHIVKLYANGEEILPVEGVYSLVANENLVITAELLSKYDGVILDGQVDQAYGEEFALAEYDDNRTITLYGVQTESGVLMHVVAVMNTTRTDAPEWWNNTNFEFRLNGAEQKYLNINGAYHGISDYVWQTAQNEAGKYVYTVEIYINNSLVPNWVAGAGVQLNYAWKTGGEGAWSVGDHIHAYALDWNMDWLSYHRAGVNLGAKDFNLGADSWGIYSDILKLTTTGVNFGVDPTKATIDGNFEEYEGLASETFGDPNRAQVTVTGKADTDGLYLAITIVHGEWSSAKNGAWADNDNLEIKINDRAAPIVFFGGRLLQNDYYDEAAAVTTTNEEGKQVTKLELFVAGAAKAYRFQVGMNGAGFGGWQSLCWDGNVRFVTNEGLVAGVSFDSQIVTDGILDDAAWTDDIKAKAHTATANGAEITMIGFSGDYGVHMAFTVKHTRPLLEACQDDGSAWWNYMGPEVRLGGCHDRQIAFTAWNNTAINCVMGYATAQNEDGTYTTTFEIFVSYEFIGAGGAKVAVAVGGVYESEFKHLWNDSDWGGKATHFVTPNGIVVGVI